MQKIIVWTQNPLKASLLRLTMGIIIGSLGYVIASLWTFLYMPFLAPFLGVETTGALLSSISSYVGILFGTVGVYCGVTHGTNLITETLKDETGQSQPLKSLKSIIMPSTVADLPLPRTTIKSAEVGFTSEKNTSIDSTSPLCPKSPAIF